MRRTGWFLVALAILVASSCSGDGGGDDAGGGGRGGGGPTAERPFEPVGDLVAEVDGVGLVYSGTVDGDDLDAVEVDATAADEAPPDDLGALAVGEGLSVDVSAVPEGRFEVRLRLPEPPSDEAIPGVIHVGDDGSVRVEPGLWDPERNEIIVTTAEFSDRWGAWWDPRNWVEEVVQVGQGAFDFVADFVTGRTDPPHCEDDTAPPWGAITKRELASLHTCTQRGRTDKGIERYDVLLASNRRTAQVVSIPRQRDDADVAGQPDIFGPALAFAAGADHETDVVLLGGHKMTVGFRQPVVSTTFDLRAHLTWQLTAANPVLAMLGELPLEGVLGVALATSKCLSEFSGIDPRRLDSVPDGFASPSQFLGQLVRCAFDALQQPELITALVDDLVIALGIPAGAATDLKTLVSTQAGRIAQTAKRIALPLTIAMAGTTVWDLVFDHLAAGEVHGELVGTLADDELLSMAPCHPGCARSGVVELDHPTWGDVWLATFGPSGAPGLENCGADALVIDREVEVRWSWSYPDCMNLFGPAGNDPEFDWLSDVPSPVDDAGRVYLDFDPGRYNGVAVLSPVDGGFDDHGTLPTPENLTGRFYNATAVDIDGDGTYEIENNFNPCYPSCAEGTISSYVAEWRDGDFVFVLPTFPVECGGQVVDFAVPDEVLDSQGAGIICPDVEEAVAAITAATPPYSGQAATVVDGWACTLAIPEFIELYDCHKGDAQITFRRYVGEGD